MPNWKKVIVSGSDATLNSLTVTSGITVTGSLLLTSSYISTVDYIDFNNTGITPPTDIEGRIYWDEDNGTLSLGMAGGQVVQQIGLEEYFYIKNQTGTTIPNGSVVRAAGTVGASGRILGDLMIADSSITYYFTLGIATEDIINGEDGYVTNFGNVRGINTTGASIGETWVNGDVLWVSPTVLGGLTKFEPDSPNLKIQMAIVTNAAVNGTLFVRPDLSGFLTDLHNVNDFTTTSSFGDLLVKSGSTWINSQQLTGSYGLTGSLIITGSLNVSGSSVFQSNTTSDVIRITQTGTGDALRVEDSTNPDATPTVITADGSVLIGTGSSSATTKLYVKNGSSGVSSLPIATSLTVENSTTNYIGLFAPNANESGIYMGSPSDSFGAVIRWGFDTGNILIGAQQSGHGIRFTVGNKTSSSLFLTPTALATSDPNATLTLTGSFIASQNITASRMILSASNSTLSGTTLTVIGSGSTQPVFAVQGSSGELFSVTDSLTGSLFSVNDISGLPIIEVFSDNTTLIGNYLAPMLITTAKVTQTNSGSFVVYSLPTASYDTAFFEYSVRSGSNARAGTIMAIQSGSSVNFTETTTLDLGSTTAISFVVVVTGSNIALTGSSTTGSWTIKSIVRGI